MADEPNTSLIVLYSLIFLFIVFIVLEQPATTSLVTLPLVGEVGEVTTIIIIALLVLIVAAGIFLLYKNYKIKKEPEVPKPENLPELSSKLSSLELSKKPSSKEGLSLTEEDINKLFIESEEPKTEYAPIPTPTEKEPEKEILYEKKVDYKELKSLMVNLLSKDYTHDSILKYLKSKGYTLTQIRKVIDDINQDNLAHYIKQSFSLGISKDEIVRNLLARGWNMQEIRKHL